MRIGCLQFAPQVGDVDNNLNRADAVLNRSPDVDDLDLLVLPELAFTGYNFKSLTEIAPYLEPTGSGISALWARTTALKHNCNVVVGYPEKVDVAHKWPTSPEYYNSAIMINPNGETVANYRKSFLYTTDESWALEGDGFFEDQLPGLGTVAMGICMDMNPYKFEAPFHAFEFAFHILEVEANLVILTMSWFTREEPRKFTQLPLEPDMDTLEYWLTRLEPVIRNESQEEIIVVFCNRTGVEDDVVYAGTSAVVGIKDGEVNLYGLLGRGTKELLVADTEKRPLAKVVREVYNNNMVDAKDGRPASQPVASPHNPGPAASHSASRAAVPLPQLNTNVSHEETSVTPVNGKKARVATPIVREELGNWDFMLNHHFAIGSPSMVAHSDAESRGRKVPKLGLQIPADAHESPVEHHNEQGGDIPTPTAPSPTPVTLRPKISFPTPAAASRSMIPSSVNTKSGASIVEVRRTDSPITPPSRPSANSTSRRQASISEAPPSPPTDDKLGHAGSMTNQKQRSASASAKTDKLAVAEQALRTAKVKAVEQQQQLNLEASNHTNRLHSLDLIDTGSPAYAGSNSFHGQPSEMKEKKEKKGGLLSQPLNLDPMSAVSVDTRRELDLAFAAIETPPAAMLPERPPSTKSRNASLSRPQSINGLQHHRRSLSQSHMSIPIIASPSIFRTEDEASQKTQQSALYFRPEGSVAAGTPNFRTPSQSRKSHSMTRVETHSGLPMVPGSFSQQRLGNSGVAELGEADNGRPMSRGRQPFTKTNPTNGVPGASRQSQVIPRVARAAANSRQSSGSRPNGAGGGRPNGAGGGRPNGAGGSRPNGSGGSRPNGPDGRAATGSNSQTRGRASTSSGPWMVGPPPASQTPGEPGNEFIAMISLIDGSCPVHSGSGMTTTSTQATSQSRRQQRTPPSQDVQATQQQQQQSETAATEQASRTGTAQSRSTQPAGTPSQSSSAPDQNLYEVILAPHIRDIVESFASRDRTPRTSGSSRMSNSSRQARTPIFDPPTPTAMEFTPPPVDATEPAAATAVKVE